MKKVFIGVLAALMLFAFTACENGSGSALENSIITKIEVTSEAPSYFVGDAISTSDFTVVATRLDGSTFVVPASDLDLTDNETVEGAEAVDEARTVATVAYTGYSYGTTNPVTAELKAYVYQLDQIKVEGPATPETYYIVKPDAEIEFHTEYNPASYTVTGEALDDDNEVIYSRELVYSEETADSEYTVAAAKDDTNLTSGEGTLTFTVADALSSSAEAKEEAIICQPDRMVSAKLAANPNVKFIAGDVAANYTNSTYFNVTAEYVSGYSEKLTSGFSVTFDSSSLTNDNLPSATGAAATASATISGQTVKANPITVYTSANYITGYTASYQAQATVKPGEKVQKDLVTITPVWKVENKSTFTPSFTVSDSDGTMPQIASGSTYVFTVVLTNPEAADAEPGYALLTVTAGDTTTTKQ